MEHIDLNALADFALVGTAGGLGPASRAGRRSKATLSRRLAELEEQLGLRLVERSARGLALTEAGQWLLARVEGPLADLAEAAAAVREGQGAVKGRLRIAAPLLFSQLAMGRLCADFRQRYPEVQVELVAEDRLVDLVEERFDLAIRPNPRMESTLVGRCFARDRQVVVAAPGLPRPAGAGAVPVPVPAVLMAGREGQLWTLDTEAAGSEPDRLVIEPVPVLQLSSLLSVRDAAVAGAGAALLPRSIVGERLARGELVQWGTAQGRAVELWVLHTSRRLTSPKVKAFVDFIVERYAGGDLELPG